MKVALVQMNSQGDKAANLAQARRLIEEAVAAERPDLIVLPEYWACLAATREEFHASAESFEPGAGGPACALIREMATRHGIVVHAGSMVERAGDSFFNATLVIGRDGSELAHYRKMHLFDVEVPGGVTYKESATISRGQEVVTYQLDGWTVGCSICYDLRFPELFQALRDKGAEVIVLPAAFTLQTGKDHWELLARARAAETQTWFLADAQVGTHAGGANACWGHAMVIDPWGAIVAQASDRPGFTTARLDKAYQKTIRTNLPVASHHVLHKAA
jgi:deaminated glutathione amidase